MFNGFLFIGDPHLLSKRPGRRQDDYCKVSLDKLAQAAKIACEKMLVPVILGDLFDGPAENDLWLLNRLAEIAKSFPVTPITLAGNHDADETQVKEKDALSLMNTMGIFRSVESKGYVDSFEFNGQKVHLWATPFGVLIDDSIEAKEGVNVMITHHDLAFAGAYPGAALLKEIVGCDMAVNGHMHKTAKSVVRGKTTWHNPGNITRLSHDVIDHVPSVWGWYPENGVALEQYTLHYVRDVFNMTGLEVEAAKPAELKKTLPRMMPLSQFSELIKGNNSMDASATEDSSVMVEELRGLLDRDSAPETLRSYLSALAKAANAERTN